MVKIKNSKCIHLILLLFILLGCNSAHKNISSQEYNHLVEQALQYVIANKCLDNKTFPDDTITTILSVCSDLISIDTADKVEGIDLTLLLNNGVLIENIDTINIHSRGNKKVYMSSWEDMIIPLEFGSSFSKRISSQKTYSHVKSYMVSKPYSLKENNKHYLVIKIAMYFEYIYDYVYVKFEINHNHKIVDIYCYRKEKQIPKHYISTLPTNRPDKIKHTNIYYSGNNIVALFGDTTLLINNTQEKYIRENANFIGGNNILYKSCISIADENFTKLDLKFMDKGSILLTSLDSCSNIHSGKYFSQIQTNEKNYKAWDKIEIIHILNDSVITKVITSKDKNFRYFLLTLDQEVDLVLKGSLSLLEGGKAEPDVYNLTIYSGEEILLSKKNVKFGRHLTSLWHLFYKE
ncbi:MAG: hypothetical protein WAT79_09735 [Saprospiraceae bacterium]